MHLSDEMFVEAASHDGKEHGSNLKERTCDGFSYALSTIQNARHLMVITLQFVELAVHEIGSHVLIALTPLKENTLLTIKHCWTIELTKEF